MFEFYKKLNLIVPKSRRIQMIYLSILLTIGMALEVLGLGIILPVLGVILDENILNDYPYLISLFNNLGLYNYKSISIFLVVLLPIIYLFKTIFLVLVNFVQNKFVQVTIRDIVDTLFFKYLNQTYESFISRNTSEYLKVIQTESLYFTTYLQAILTIITETALTMAVLFIFIWIDPIGAVGIFMFFGILSGLFFQLSKNILKSWGQKREVLDKSISKIILESFGNIREVKIFNRSDFFSNKLKNENFSKTKLTYLHTTLVNSPRFYLELVSVIALSIFIVSFISQEKNIVELISIIGVFVAGSFRVIPSLNRIISARQHIKYHENTLDLIFNELNQKENEPDIFEESNNNFEFKSSIRLKDISFKYLKADDYILNNINFEIFVGESVGIIGKSGSGKSTFVDIFSGLLFPQSGSVSIDNYILKNKDFPRWKNLIGYVSQSTNLIDDSILANVAFGDLNPNKNRVDSVLKDAQLYEYVYSLPDGINTNIGENGINLSGGQIQRLAIARALYKQPKILILDEATSSLDNDTENFLIKSINTLKRKVTILMIAHRLTTLSDCDRIYELTGNKFKVIEKEKLKIK